MLKNLLYQQRVEWTKNGYEPVCAICGQPSTIGALQMHESLITRGNIRGNKELMDKIMVSSNCVLVDPICHESADSPESKIACVKNILKYNKYEDVLVWLSDMSTLMRNDVPFNAIRLVTGVRDEM